MALGWGEKGLEKRPKQDGTDSGMFSVKPHSATLADSMKGSIWNSSDSQDPRNA